jgi:sterol desaturase/sphingolipid hydroxylase (fatty acid hydroxylase superfamily)
VKGLDTNAYYALGAPLYVLVVGLEVWALRRRRVRAFRFADTIGNLSAGLGEVLLGIFIGPLLYALYELGYRRIALVHWPDGTGFTIASWVTAFLAADLCYYWYHRAGHRVAALWSIHGVHHQTEEMNVTVAMRHPWLSDTYSALFYVPMPVLGISAPRFFIAISIISFYALTIHSRTFNRPSLYIFTTPATHVLHHARNPRYLGKNLGAMFTLWDRLFGTYVELDPADPPVLGIRSGYETHDGARSQWVIFDGLAQVARQAASRLDALRVFVRHPGWLPKGATAPKRPHARADDEIPVGVKAYVGTQFVLVVGFALYVLTAQNEHTLAESAVLCAAIAWALTTLGGLLDGRVAARRHELVRLWATTALAVWFIHVPGLSWGAGALLASTAVGLAWLTVRPGPIEAPATSGAVTVTTGTTSAPVASGREAT